MFQPSLGLLAIVGGCASAFLVIVDLAETPQLDRWWLELLLLLPAAAWLLVRRFRIED